jgi:hypothetical protein
VVITAWLVRPWFTGSPRRQSQLGAAGGLMMIGLGGTLAVTGNKV